MKNETIHNTAGTMSKLELGALIIASQLAKDNPEKFSVVADQAVKQAVLVLDNCAEFESKEKAVNDAR